MSNTSFWQNISWSNRCFCYSLFFVHTSLSIFFSLFPPKEYQSVPSTKQSAGLWMNEHSWNPKLPATVLFWDELWLWVGDLGSNARSVTDWFWWGSDELFPHSWRRSMAARNRVEGFINYFQETSIWTLWGGKDALGMVLGHADIEAQLSRSVG